MRILVDEDLASRELIGHLQKALGDEVLVPQRGATDSDVWHRAQAEGAAILTGNVVDFLRLATERSQHHGLLLVYRTNDRSRELRAAAIARAVIAIAQDNADGIGPVILAVNDLV